MRAALMAVLCLASACAGLGVKDSPGGDELPDMNERYLKAVRWKNYQSASAYWQPDKRDAWLERMEAEEDLVNYQALDVRGVRPVANPDPEIKKVEVRVRVELYRNDTLVLQKKKLVLVWQELGGGWFIVEERWLDEKKPDQKGTSDSSPGP